MALASSDAHQRFPVALTGKRFLALVEKQIAVGCSTDRDLL
jgi:hypothetical protein